jgi:hypothetical protein
LTERNEIRVGRVIDPTAAHDEFFAEIAEVRDRAAERGNPKLEERE